MRRPRARTAGTAEMPAGDGESGFTLLEAVVAILLLLVALASMLGTVGLQQKHVDRIESFARVRGVADVARGRAVVTVLVGSSGGQSCDLRLEALDAEGEALIALVQTGDPGTLPIVEH
jgi:type II secretory pathway pseudopilin PulG